MASPRRQRTNSDHSQEPPFLFFGQRKIFFWRKGNLQDCNIPSRRTQETSWAMISRIPPRYCLCCVFGRRFVEVLRRFRAQMVFEICASRGGAKVRAIAVKWSFVVRARSGARQLPVPFGSNSRDNPNPCSLTYDLKAALHLNNNGTGLVMRKGVLRA